MTPTTSNINITKKRNYEKIIHVLLILVGLTTYGQTTINPDTVCEKQWRTILVTNTVGSTYQWTITGGGGLLQTGQGTNSITVDWEELVVSPKAVEVIETNLLTVQAHQYYLMYLYLI